MGKLAGKIAIITGAASGMGAAQARLFVAEGAQVMLADIKPQGEAIAAELGPTAAFTHLDVGSENSWDDAVRLTEARFGGVDVLVNTAGICYLLPLAETSLERFERQIRVNQIGVFLGMRAVLDAMKRRGGGAIVNIASGAALRGFPLQASYAATKWAVRGMTRCAAVELAPFGIRVNGIYPGPIDTPMLGRNSDEVNRQLVAATPAGRLGSADEIAAATVFLASDEAKYCAGAELAIDGGITL